MGIVVVGLSHRTSPVAIRERLAFAEAEIPAALERLRQVRGFAEAAILSTCNRVELYVADDREPDEARQELTRFLTEGKDCGPALREALYSHGEPASLEHLFRVASGLDSMMLGETEILGQLKKAYQVALSQGHTGSRLNKAFQRAFNAAKQIRTETNIQRGSVSVAAAAVELAEKIFTSLEKKTVMVLGAGETSEKTARALLSRGAAGILVTNRSFERAEALAATFSGQAVPFDRWEEEFDRVDIVISSTSAPSYVLKRTQLEPLQRKRRRRPLLLIDIAVPRDIDPEVNLLDDVFLYNIDDLQGIADDGLRQRREEITRCESIIREKVKKLTSRRPPNVPIR